MRNASILLAVPLVGALLAAPSARAQTTPVIDIFVPEKVVHAVGMPLFQLPSGGPSELAVQFTDGVAADLTYTGLFRVLSRAAYLEKPGAVPIDGEGTRWDDWSVLKASVLVRGAITVKGNQVGVEAYAFHVESKRVIGRKQVQGRSENTEELIHKTADAIYRLLTGEDGFFNTKIAYVNDRTGNKELYVADFDGTHERPITRNRSINLAPSWSPAGDKIAFTSYVNGNPDLFLYEGGSGKFFRLSNRKGINIGAAYSPRGRVVAATLSLKRGNPDIYLLNEDGSGPRRVTDSYANDVSPTWSPDARRIAFVSDRAGTPNIYVQNPTGGRPKRLTFKHKDNQSPSWSPRGDRIAFCARVSGRWQVFTMDTSGGDLRQVTTSGGNSEEPEWSPDGRMIIFTSDRTGRKQLWVMEADGANPRQITHGKGRYSNPAWGPRVR